MGWVLMGAKKELRVGSVKALYPPPKASDNALRRSFMVYLEYPLIVLVGDLRLILMRPPPRNLRMHEQRLILMGILIIHLFHHRLATFQH
jgi:hypothetical protein